MKNHVEALAEALRLARRELERHRDPGSPVSSEVTVGRLSEVLERDDLNEALAALEPVDDAPSMKSDPPVDLRVPYPWRSHRVSRGMSNFGHRKS
jgi:hypothetical protein